MDEGIEMRDEGLFVMKVESRSELVGLVPSPLGEPEGALPEKVSQRLLYPTHGVDIDGVLLSLQRA